MTVLIPLHLLSIVVALVGIVHSLIHWREWPLLVLAGMTVGPLLVAAIMTLLHQEERLGDIGANAVWTGYFVAYLVAVAGFCIRRLAKRGVAAQAAG